MNEAMADLFGPAISVYTREQAISDGVLVDVTEWGSADKGFHGGFTCPVAMTRALWEAVDGKKPRFQDTRGRAHDVLWMASLAVRGMLGRDGGHAVNFRMSLQIGRTRNQVLRVAVDGDGVTIGFPSDF